MKEIKMHIKSKLDQNYEFSTLKNLNRKKRVSKSQMKSEKITD